MTDEAEVYWRSLEQDHYDRWHERAAKERVANGHDTKAKIEPFKTVQASSFAGQPVPVQKYLDGRQTVPIGSVTLITGSGGVGKTIVALQLAVACAAKGRWLGYPANQYGRGVVLFYSGEEPLDVIHRHIANICQSEGLDLAKLTGLHIIAATDEEAGPGLFTQTRGKSESVEPTRNFHRLKANVALSKPDLIIADNRGQIVEGDENKRVVAHQTMTPLSLLARRNDSAFILLAHPSMSGEQSGSGQSGSTAWYAAARSQLHMTRPKEEDGTEDPSSLERIIRVKKNQYDRNGATINLAWDNGCYVCTDAAFQRAGADMGQESKAENIFLFLTGLYNDQGLDLSPSPSSPNYAPKLFCAHPKRDKVTFKEFDKAMKILLESGRVAVKSAGSASRGKKQLVVGG